MTSPTDLRPASKAPEPTWPEPVGVGLSFMPGRTDMVAELLPHLDYVEMNPELFATPAGGDRVVFGTEDARSALEFVGPLPVVIHGLELSIGSAHGWNDAALHCLDGLLALRTPPWHSEHLTFLSTTAADGSVTGLGLPMPLPFTSECADLVAERADRVIDRYGMPFLLENSSNYLPDLPCDPGWDEARFLTALTERSRCGLLLDLFNLWTNCVNHRLDPEALLAGLPLDRVVEIHVAGGEERHGMLTDSHSAAVPEQVWRMAESVVGRAPRLAGLTVEVLDIHAGDLGVAAMREDLVRARAVWDAR